MQKERQITIKPCDKGAGIIILNFTDYTKACYEHSESKQNETLYYSKVGDAKLEDAKKAIQHLIEEGLGNNYLTTSEFQAMKHEGKGPSRFYCNFKVHKQYEHVPPVRPIVSGSGSFIEKIGKFVAHHLKDVSNKNDTFIEDSTDFIRHIEEINKNNIPSNALLVTMDVSGLFTNIPKKEGLESASECLDERESKKIPSKYLLKLLELIIEKNIFEFNEEIFIQNIGTGMGQPPAPPYANCFMGKKMDIKI